MVGDADVRRFTCADGRALAYVEYGAPGGAPALFIHGCLGSRISAAPFDRAASEENVRLIAIDKPGFGYSDLRPGMTLKSWAVLIDAFIRHLGLDKLSLVTSSGGTPYGLSCALYIPHAIRSVLMINPIMDGTVATAARMKSFSHPLVHGWLRRFPGATYAMLSLAGMVFSRMSDLAVRLLHRRELTYLRRQPAIYGNRKATIREALRQGCRGLHNELQTYAHPWRLAVDTIRTDVIIVQGLRDANRHVADYYRGVIPHARLVTFPDEDHLSLAYNQSRPIFALIPERGPVNPAAMAWNGFDVAGADLPSSLS